MSSPLDSLTRYITRLQTQRFWGDVTIDMKDGQITLMHIHQQLKPEALSNSANLEERPNGNAHPASR